MKSISASLGLGENSRPEVDVFVLYNTERTDTSGHKSETNVQIVLRRSGPTGEFGYSPSPSKKKKTEKSENKETITLR